MQPETAAVPSGSAQLETYMDRLSQRLDENGVVGLLSVTLLDRERGTPNDAWPEYHACRDALAAFFDGAAHALLRQTDETLPALVNGNTLLVMLAPPRDGRPTTNADLPAVRQRVRYALSAHLSSVLPAAAVEAFGVYVGAALMRNDENVPCRRIVYRCVEEAFADATRQRAGECASSAADIHRVLRTGSLGTVFQPLVDIDRRRVFAFEALTRVLGGPFTRPDLLFGAAARHGMLWELERICREQALDGAARLGDGELLFLNIERDSMHDPALFGDFVDRVHDAGLVPERIVLELTEHSSIRDFEGFRRVRDDCRQLGIRIALDDVGSGFSSLQAIAEIEPDFLKVDMSLVRDVHLRAIKRELIATIHDFSEKTGSTMIAEGVEYAEELDALCDLGVRCAQGYLFAKPGAPPPAPDWDRIPTRG